MVQVTNGRCGHLPVTKHGADLDHIIAPSPHYSGIPEMLALAKKLNLEFPKEIVIFAIEVIDPHTIGGGLTQPIHEKLSALIKLVKDQLTASE
jgi:hydrogenase maturation protease